MCCNRQIRYCVYLQKIVLYIWCVYLSKTKKLRNMGNKNGCGNAILLILSSKIARFGGRKCANIVFVCILITYRQVPKWDISFTLLVKKGSVWANVMLFFLSFVTRIYLKSILLSIHFYTFNLFDIILIFYKNDVFY